MINIIGRNVKDYVGKLTTEITTYEETKDKLFMHLKNSCISWRDGNADYFLNDINEEKLETEKVIDLLKNIKDLFDKIYLSYEVIGDELKIEETTNKLAEEMVNDCSIYCDYIIQCLSGADANTSSQISSIKNSLNNVKKNVVKYYNLAISNEDSIKTAIDNIEIPEIAEYSFEFTHNNASINYVKRADMEIDISNISLYMGEEENNLTVIKSLLKEIKTYYSSLNSKGIDDLIEKAISNLDLMMAKRPTYKKVLDTIMEKNLEGYVQATTILEGSEL